MKVSQVVIVFERVSIENIREREVKMTDKIEKAASELIGLVSVTETKVKKVTADLTTEEISKLRKILKKREEEEDKSYYNRVDEVQRQAGNAPHSMTDFYDNEITTAHIGRNRTLQKIDNILKFLD